MSHLVILIYSMALLLGLLALSILGFLTFRSRDRRLALILLFYVAYSLDMAASITMRYVEANLPGLLNGSNKGLALVSPVFHYLLMAALLTFSLGLGRPGRVRTVAAAAASLALATLVAELTGLPVVPDVVFFGAIIVALGAAMVGFSRLAGHEKWFMTRLIVVITVFFPWILNDDLLLIDARIRFSPLMYASLSILLLWFVTRFYMREYYLSPEEQAVLHSDGATLLFDRWGLSPREREVALLLLQGYSNSRIGATLFVSLSTVKSHVYSLYRKSGVANRYELISLAKNHTKV